MEQAEKRKYLIETLLAEQPGYRDMEIPDESGEQKRLLRSLFNVRMPGRINEDFLNSHNGKILYLELGVGYNTPGIIKYPFWQMTADNPDAVYACVNFGEAVCPEDIMAQAICIDGDIGTVIDELRM